MTTYTTTNPVTGERVKEFPTATDEAVRAALTSSAAAYVNWRSLAVKERAEALGALAQTWRKHAAELAELPTLEMGKPIAQAQTEVELCARILEYYASQGPAFLEDEVLEIAGEGSAVVRTEAIGPILGVMPWNYPYYQVIRFAAPNLVLGNTVLVKHASNCPQSALAIAELAEKAGLPKGVYMNLFVNTDQVADIITDPRVQGVSVTGSERAGSAIGEIAGRHLKKFVLELGGSDPFLVLDGHRLDEAVAAGVNNRLTNGGQACTASKRFIVVDAVYDEFVERFADALRRVRPADPTDPDTRLGPLSSPGAAVELRDQVDDAVAKGATVLVGDEAEVGSALFAPVLLTDVTPDMRAYREELFGPVAVVHRVESEEAALTLANDSPFGLGAAIFTADPAQGRRVADRIEVGMVWINGTSRSAPELPFGGVKRSGVGRELARFGIDEFANKKLIRTVA